MNEDFKNFLKRDSNEDYGIFKGKKVFFKFEKNKKFFLKAYKICYSIFK